VFIGGYDDMIREGRQPGTELGAPINSSYAIIAPSRDSKRIKTSLAFMYVLFMPEVAFKYPVQNARQGQL
jgi:hypothetical protein